MIAVKHVQSSADSVFFVIDHCKDQSWCFMQGLNEEQQRIIKGTCFN